MGKQQKPAAAVSIRTRTFLLEILGDCVIEGWSFTEAIMPVFNLETQGFSRIKPK